MAPLLCGQMVLQIDTICCEKGIKIVNNPQCSK